MARIVRSIPISRISYGPPNTQEVRPVLQRPSRLGRANISIGVKTRDNDKKKKMLTFYQTSLIEDLRETCSHLPRMERPPLRPSNRQFCYAHPKWSLKIHRPIPYFDPIQTKRNDWINIRELKYRGVIRMRETDKQNSSILPM